MADLVMRVLARLWITLQPLGFPAAVMGGIAVSFWKHVRATQDVDLLVGAPPEREEELLAVLAAAGFRAKREPPVIELGGFRLLQLLYEPEGSFMDVQVDLLLASTEHAFQALERRLPAPVPSAGIEAAVLACEDLILFKLIAGRILDRADVGALLRANRATLDGPYLVRWAGKQGTLAALREIWEEALPGESAPEP